MLSSVSFPAERFVVDGIIRACLHVAGHSRSQSPRFFWSRGRRNTVKPSGSGDENGTQKWWERSKWGSDSGNVSRTKVIEIKYFSANITVIHTENCKLMLNLNCSPRELQKIIIQNCRQGNTIDRAGTLPLNGAGQSRGTKTPALLVSKKPTGKRQTKSCAALCPVFWLIYLLFSLIRLNFA